MEMIDIKNKKLRDDEFYKIRKEVLATWETGKEVDLDEAIAYHKSLPEHKVFSNKLNKAKKEGKTLVQPRAGVGLIENHIELLKHLQDAGKRQLPSIPQRLPSS